MTTLDVRRSAVSGGPTATLRQLAWVEAKRFALHPVFLIGVVLLVIPTVAVADDRSPDSLGTTVFPAFFIGIFSFVAAYRLTRSTRPAAEAVDAAPVGETTRTAALLLACLVPAAVALLWLVSWLVALERWAPDAWAWGAFGAWDRLAVFVGGSVVAALGASLLGVAVGRWLRFPGAGVIGVVVLMTWSIMASGLSSERPAALWAEVIRLSAPYALFAELVSTRDRVLAWTGSPGWHLAYLLMLCALAAVAALLHGAERATRAKLVRVGVGVAVAAIVFHVLAVAGGLERPVQHYRDGSPSVVFEG